LFLRGTQLSQLSEEYEICSENITQTHRIIEQKKEAIPDLQAAFKDASTRFNEAKKARELKDRVSGLKKELAWAHVAGKQAELEDKVTELANLENGLPEFTRKVDEARVCIASVLCSECANMTG
jgi:structural maintenance of chromosomes protein 6